MSLAARTTLGPYEIVAPLGAGGMGEVYRARDTKLNRDVALKILPGAFTEDADRLARFKREAQVLAALNHPNIAAIHGLEDSGATHALVMELVEGEDLAAHVGRGPVPIAEALPIARQIADALEAAHEQGIVHRDLKPANVKVRPDGTVKVLDFGLAKAMDPAAGSSAAADAANSPTLTGRATQMGVILGTAAYMAPEQARGKTVDRRADIWAFGVVLYEILTGRRCFDGDDVSITLAHVLTGEVRWDALPPGTPPRLRRLLERCLDRDVKTRLRDIGEARVEIARIESGAPESGVSGVTRMAAAERSPGLGWLTILPWAVAATLAPLALWLAMRAQPAGGAPVTRALLSVAPAERLLSGYPGDVSRAQGRPSRTAMAFSPDGRSLVFSAEREGRVQLYLRRLDQLDAIPIAGTEGASTPFFAPDGQAVGFYAAGALRKVPVGGGPVVELCKTDLVFGASWSNKDQIVFANVRSGLFKVSPAVATPTPVTKLDAGEVSHRLPQVLPDGDTVLFTVTNAAFPTWDDTRVVAQSLTTGTRKTLIEGAADARFVSTGHLLYLRRGTLMAVPFDLRRLEVTGPAVGVASDVMQAADIQPVWIDTGAGQFAVSNDGALVYATGGVFPEDRWSLVWVDRTGRSEALRVPPGIWHAPRLSPDGRRVAFHGRVMGKTDLWTYDVQRGAASAVRTEGKADIPVWTPDGSRLAVIFQPSGFSGTGNLLLIDPDGRFPAERLTSSGGSPGSWTPDGRDLTFTRVSTDRTRSIWLASRDGKTEPRQLLAEGTEPALSSDGRWMAYVSGSPSQVYVQPYPALDHRVQVSVDGGTEPAWRRDGREMYYLQNVSAGGALKVRVMAVSVTTTPAFSVGTPHVLFEGAFRDDGGHFRNYDVTPDGQRFLMAQEVQRPPARVSQMVLVENWGEELKQRVPVKK
jgi:eukaryotic-like serine/threonine-protein kinase